MEEDSASKNIKKNRKMTMQCHEESAGSDLQLPPGTAWYAGFSDALSSLCALSRVPLSALSYFRKVSPAGPELHLLVPCSALLVVSVGKVVIAACG